MIYKIGIRCETKLGEKRTPLCPSAVKRLKEEHNIHSYIQPCKTRAFSDNEFEKVGGIIKEDLAECPIVLGIKEMDIDIFKPENAYLCFHHVIKGQKTNMPMLNYMMKIGCTMIDYERVTDDNQKRLIFFGRHAGFAGMIDTLHGLGLRLKEVDKIDSPFLKVKQSCNYFDLAEAKGELKKVATIIEREGLPEELCPLVFGFLGYGNVSQGAQSILDIFPIKTITPNELEELVRNPNIKEYRHWIYKVVFKEEHMFFPKESSQKFELQDYYIHPEKYESLFAKKFLNYITVLVNGAYWSAKYPRSVTKHDLKDLYNNVIPPKLKIIGDISCDIEGGIEGTIRISYIDQPYYVYDPITNVATDGVIGNGPVILAIDHLPAEIPRDASEFFSDTLLPFIPNLAQANYKGTLEESGLQAELKRAVILWKGKLTPEYEYINDFLKK